jgi:fatty acid/phospholipid biosynthesis enzyme
MDYKQYGGALFLGVKKPVVKAHRKQWWFSFLLYN